ncbi:hypothetical protein ASF70_10935 [Rhizobium sp. Leaf321]|jgi:hypothetical protein|nr:hypothetical protein ASF70_10935 [Rhizobium sp. Leaf321]
MPYVGVGFEGGSNMAVADQGANNHADRGANNALAPENNFPEKYFVAGVAVGLFLVLLGTAILLLGRSQTASSLTICVGFGLVLAAFGAKVAGNWAGWSVTGAGAMAVVLFLMLQQFTPPGTPALFKGEISGDFSHVADIRIIDDEPLYIYKDAMVRRIKFLGLGTSLQSTQMRMQVDTIEKEAGKEYFELIGDAQKIRAIFAEGRPVQWRFDYNARQVKNGSLVLLSELDTLSPGPTAEVSGSTTGAWWDLSAFAQAAVRPEASVDQIQKALAGLRNEDTFLRRNSRDFLVSAGVVAVPMMLSALHASPDDYRVKLGVVYALAEMIRSDPNLASSLSQKLAAEDFPLLIQAAADPDKTIRYQAADFLYRLQDPRAVELSVNAAKDTTDQGVANNQILILRQSGSNLSSSQKSDIVRQLNDPSTNLNRSLKAPSSLNDVLKW